jgi:hypothetical protein
MKQFFEEVKFNNNVEFQGNVSGIDSTKTLAELGIDYSSTQFQQGSDYVDTVTLEGIFGNRALFKLKFCWSSNTPFDDGTSGYVPRSEDVHNYPSSWNATFTLVNNWNGLAYLSFINRKAEYPYGNQTASYVNDYHSTIATQLYAANSNIGFIVYTTKFIIENINAGAAENNRSSSHWDSYRSLCVPGFGQNVLIDYDAQMGFQNRATHNIILYDDGGQWQTSRTPVSIFNVEVIPTISRAETHPGGAPNYSEVLVSIETAYNRSSQY